MQRPSKPRKPRKPPAPARPQTFVEWQINIKRPAEHEDRNPTVSQIIQILNEELEPDTFSEKYQDYYGRHLKLRGPIDPLNVPISTACNWNDYCITCSVEVENPSFDDLLERYNKEMDRLRPKINKYNEKMAEYNVKLEQWKKDMVPYKKWLKNKQLKELQARQDKINKELREINHEAAELGVR